MIVKFTIDGPPKGKGRPQFARRGNRVTARTPEKTASYEELVRWCWKVQCGQSFPQGTPLRVEIRAFFPIPSSFSKKKRDALKDTPHIKKPDADNVAKAVVDALNYLAFHDDSAICDLITIKRYSENPRVEVRIEEA